MLWEHRTTVLVNEDVIYERSRINHGCVFYNRAAAPTTPATPLSLLTPPRRNMSLYEDKFAGVYPVIEAFGLNYIQPGSYYAPPAMFFKPTPRPPDVEPEYYRTDHGKYFSMVRRYVAQLVGYTIEVPDLNGPEWIEWIRPPTGALAALLPFRQTPSIPVRGQQFNLYYGQPKIPRFVLDEPEPNPYVPTRYDALFLPLPPILPVLPVITFPPSPQNLRSSSTKPPVVLQWDPVLVATSYTVYRDNQIIASVTAPSTTYSDLITQFNRKYHYMVTAVNSLGESEGSTPVFNVYVEPNGTLKFEVVYHPTAGHLGTPDIEWTWD